MITDQLLRSYPIISDQVDERELRVLLRELERLLRAGCQGSVVEFGCYVGTTSLFIRRLLDAYQHAGAFHVYDSFAGLPEKSAQDASAAGEQFVAGELAATRKGFLQQFKKARLRPPVVHKGWFAEGCAGGYYVCLSRWRLLPVDYGLTPARDAEADS